jgi:hypothetical protein
MTSIQLILGTFLSLSLAQTHAAEPAPSSDKDTKNKIKVCTASISTTAESEVFKKNLMTGENAGKFEFVELTELGTPAGQQSGVVNNWFERACQTGIQCNMLVLSAHFSSTGFFSDRTNPNPLRYPLKTKQIEAQACEKSCSGILNNPSEVFLLSCNTLASKKLDHRTPEKYLQILRNDGAFRDKAERAVEDRYGELGATNRSHIEFAFSGVPLLYGFKSTSQLAENNVKYLEKYFKDKPDYAQHLQQATMKQINKAIANLNKANPTNATNSTFMKSFAGTSSCVSSGMYSEESPEGRFWNNVCALRDQQQPFAARLNVAKKMLESADRAAYIPDIQEFLNTEVAMKQTMTPQEKDVLNEIADLQNAKKFILNQIEEKKEFPTLRKKLVTMAGQLKWIEPEKATSLMDEAQKQITDEGWDESYGY